MWKFNENFPHIALTHPMCHMNTICIYFADTVYPVIECMIDEEV